MQNVPYVIPDCATLKQLDKHYNMLKVPGPIASDGCVSIGKNMAR